MGKLLLSCCFVLLVASPSLAKNNVASHWSCGKPTERHSITVGDQANHAYAVQIGSCTVIGKTTFQETGGTGWSLVNTIGDTSTSQGVFVSTTSSGDKIHYATTQKYALKSGKIDSGSVTWSIAGGTGKFAKTAGQGTCTAKGNPDGTVAYDCVGSYTP